MAKLFVVFLVVAVTSQAFGMSFRHKRQSNNDEDSLDDRYGWDNQNRRPWQNQNQRPWQNQNQVGGDQNQNGGQFPQQNQNQNGNQNQITTTTQAPSGTGGTSSSQDCMRNCPVTPEYNPVCGTDNVTYTNPGRLGCAQACGVTVSLLRASPCPTSTTVAPPS